MTSGEKFREAAGASMAWAIALDLRERHVKIGPRLKVRLDDQIGPPTVSVTLGCSLFVHQLVMKRSKVEKRWRSSTAEASVRIVPRDA